LISIKRAKPANVSLTKSKWASGTAGTSQSVKKAKELRHIMTKHETKHAASQFAATVMPDLGNLSNFLAQSAKTYQDVWTDWQKEVADFIAERIQQDMESLDALADRREFQDLLKVQHDWYTAAMRDYAEEAQKADANRRTPSDRRIDGAASAEERFPGGCRALG
jgi:hypothetical protein